MVWRNFSTCWKILNIITWKQYCYWNQTFRAWSRLKCIIKLSLPFPSTSGVPTRIEIKGPCQVSLKELTRCLSADITCYEKQKVVEAFHGIRLCLKAPVKCKCKHKALGKDIQVLDALQLRVQEVAITFLAVNKHFHLCICLDKYILSININHFENIFEIKFISLVTYLLINEQNDWLIKQICSSKHQNIPACAINTLKYKDVSYRDRMKAWRKAEFWISLCTSNISVITDATHHCEFISLTLCLAFCYFTSRKQEINHLGLFLPCSTSQTDGEA